MIDHFGINVSDMATASAFYDKVLGVLGHRRLMDFGVAVGYGTEQPQFWISTFEGVGANREVHVAFTAPDAATVRAFGQAATDLGAEILHEPRIWPEYHEHYFAVFVRDTEGNNIEAVCHTAELDD
ncbi:VOC family protein [Microlunatus elymi]|uniref:VOC family protein n=1 Tax=Microlunatus elymi TaxID=2596828 RepID=A0A516PZ59_9ACTN|nr:VOC family protein [Microlunatus elymi]QDP96459.1 VOC family protein [Microlunatus elymi]